MKPQKFDTIIFGGGLDVVTPPLQVESGKLLEVKNFECALNGGYRVAKGFERLDGRTSPTDGSFYAIETGAFTGTFTVGETITGGTSSATGTLLTIGATGLYLVAITGTFVASEVLTGGTSSATATSTTAALANITLSNSEELNDVRYDKEIYFRDLIQTVPGINAIRGVYQHENITLAVRDFNGSEARMYKATTSGWQQITASHIVFFNTKVNPIPADGTTVNDGAGNTATLHRTSLKTVGGTVGYMVLTGYTAGFAIASNIRDGATIIATVTIAPVAVTLNPGGKNEWTSHSFTGTENYYRAYTSDGVNSMMEYDPVANVIAPIYTDQDNQASDTPTFIAAYQNQLFAGYKRGIIRNSEPADPFLWDAAAGSLETVVGAEVTGFDPVPQALIITTKRTTYALSGQIAENFVLSVASARTGARAYTMQHIGTTYMLDDRGMIELSRVQAFGDFDNATISKIIQPYLLSILDDVNTSTVSLSNNIYKIFTSDGRGVSLTFQEGQIAGFGIYDLGVTVNVISNSEDDTGAERILFGGDDGYVYELDKGRSFDGELKEYWFKTVYHFMRSSTIRKRFYRAFFDVDITGKATLQFNAEYANGSPDVRNTGVQSDESLGFPSSWDVGSWDQALWDAAVTSSAYIDLTGTGDSISLILYGNTDRDDIFTVKDVIYKYKRRRAMRGAR